MISLDIKNKLFTLFAKLVNNLDFNPKRLSIEKRGSGETCIYCIKYDKDPFYLVIDNLKGYFKQNDDNNYVFNNDFYEYKSKDDVYRNMGRH